MNSLENMIKQVIEKHYIPDDGTPALIRDLVTLIDQSVIKPLQDRIDEQSENINAIYNAQNG